MLIKSADEFVVLKQFATLYQPKNLSKDKFNINGKYYVYGANGIIGKSDFYNHEKEEIVIGQYILYKSGQKNGFTNTYTHEGIFIIANDGGEAQFKLTNAKFSYTDHCICFGCKDDATTIVLGNYLQLISKESAMLV